MRAQACAVAVVRLGVLVYKAGDFARAERWLLEAADSYASMDHDLGWALSLSSLVVTLRRAKRSPDASPYATQVVELFRRRRRRTRRAARPAHG